MKKNQSILISEPIFKQEILVTNMDDPALKKYAKRWKYEISDGDWKDLAFEPNGVGRTVRLDCGAIIVRITKDDIGITIHELSHATMYVLNTTNTPHTMENDEIFAYYIGFLARELFRLWK